MFLIIKLGFFLLLTECGQNIVTGRAGSNGYVTTPLEKDNGDADDTVARLKPGRGSWPWLASLGRYSS